MYTTWLKLLYLNYITQTTSLELLPINYWCTSLKLLCFSHLQSSEFTKCNKLNRLAELSSAQLSPSLFVQYCVQVCITGIRMRSTSSNQIHLECIETSHIGSCCCRTRILMVGQMYEIIRFQFPWSNFLIDETFYKIKLL